MKKIFMIQEKLITSRKSNTDRQYNTIQYNTIQYNTIQYNTIQSTQLKGQRYIEYYEENYRLSNTNPTKNRGSTQ